MLNLSLVVKLKYSVPIIFLLLDDTIEACQVKGIFVRELSGESIFQIWQTACISPSLEESATCQEMPGTHLITGNFKAVGMHFYTWPPQYKVFQAANSHKAHKACIATGSSTF